MCTGLITAIRTLTILPVPGAEASPLSRALPWFPLVGGALGSLLFGFVALAELLTRGGWPEILGAAVVLGGILLTRGLHLDGLADVADSVGGGRDRQKILAIMKDPNSGPFGVIALIVILLFKWVALTRLIAIRQPIWLIAAFIVSRTVLVDLAVRLPYARQENGTGAPFVREARTSHLLAAYILAMILLLSLFGPLGAGVLMVGWLVSQGFKIWSMRRIGGVTGDVLGACSEVVETVILVLAAALAESLQSCTGWAPFFTG
jgi:adenosylcobinamide-GDP ribazoletransferase